MVGSSCRHHGSPAIASQGGGPGTKERYESKDPKDKFSSMQDNAGVHYHNDHSAKLKTLNPMGEMGEVLLEKMLTTYPFHVDCVSSFRFAKLVLNGGTAHRLIQCENQMDLLRVGRSAEMLLGLL